MKVLAKGNETNTAVKLLAIPDILDVPNNRITSAELQSLLADSVPISDFVGFVEVPIDTMSEQVPSSFPRSAKNTGTDENPNWVQKIWSEYAIHRDDGTDAIMLIGFRDANGNRPDGVRWSELQKWVTEFGAANILTFNDGIDLWKTKYAPEE